MQGTPCILSMQKNLEGTKGQMLLGWNLLSRVIYIHRKSDQETIEIW